MGVRGLATLLDSRYSACFVPEPIPVEAVLVIDGNGWALALSRGVASYEAVAAAVQASVASFGARRLMAVFDGAVRGEARADREAVLAERALGRGDAAASALYGDGDGGRAVLLLAVEQCCATARSCGVEVRFADGEADDLISRICRGDSDSSSDEEPSEEGSSPRVTNVFYAVSEDSDFAACRGVRLLRLSSLRFDDSGCLEAGVVWRRAAVAEALGFGDERDICELALAIRPAS